MNLTLFLEMTEINLLQLPVEIMTKIIKKLDATDVISLSESCRLFNKMTEEKFSSDVVFCIDFEELGIEKKKSKITRWLKNFCGWKASRSVKLTDSVNILRESSRKYSILKMQNFDETKMEKKSTKILLKTLKKKAKDVKKLILVDSRFVSKASFKNLMEFFINAEFIETTNVKFSNEKEVEEQDEEIGVDAVDEESLTAMVNCHDLVTLEVELIRNNNEAAEKYLIDSQMARLKRLYNGKTHCVMDLTCLENIPNENSFFDIRTSVIFRLEELCMCRVHFQSPDIALKFLKKRSDIKHLQTNFLFGDQYQSGGLQNEQLMKEYQRISVEINQKLSQTLIKMKQDIKTLFLSENSTLLNIKLNFHVYGLKNLDTLAVRSDTSALKTINLPKGQFKTFEFMPKFDMKPEDFRYLVFFLARHHSIEKAILHIPMDTEMMDVLLDLEALRNVQCLVVETAENEELLELIMPEWMKLEVLKPELPTKTSST